MIGTIKQFIITTWNEFVDWIHQNNASVKSYVLKVLLAIFVYIIVSDIIKKAFRKVQKKLQEKEVSKAISEFGIFIPMYIILACLIINTFNHLNKIEVSPTVTLVVFLVIFLMLVAKGVVLKLITNAIRAFKRYLRGDDVDVYSNLTKVDMPKAANASTIRWLLKCVIKLAGVAIAVFIIFFSYQGIIYMMGTKGREVSGMFKKPDDYIVKELGGIFKEDDSLVEKIPIYTDGNVKVKTNGELNIIYVNDKRIGFNTTSRDLRIYGVAINQMEINLTHNMTFFYNEKDQALDNAYGSSSGVTFFRNTSTNECLAVVIGGTSHRVVSVSYFTDYNLVTQNIMMTGE